VRAEGVRGKRIPSPFRGGFAAALDSQPLALLFYRLPKWHNRLNNNYICVCISICLTLP